MATINGRERPGRNSTDDRIEQCAPVIAGISYPPTAPRTHQVRQAPPGNRRAGRVRRRRPEIGFSPHESPTARMVVNRPRPNRSPTAHQMLGHSVLGDLGDQRDLPDARLTNDQPGTASTRPSCDHSGTERRQCRLPADRNARVHSPIVLGLLIGGYGCVVATAQHRVWLREVDADDSPGFEHAAGKLGVAQVERGSVDLAAGKIEDRKLADV